MHVFVRRQSAVEPQGGRIRRLGGLVSLRPLPRFPRTFMLPTLLIFPRFASHCQFASIAALSRFPILCRTWRHLTVCVAASARGLSVASVAQLMSTLLKWALRKRRCSISFPVKGCATWMQAHGCYIRPDPVEIPKIRVGFGRIGAATGRLLSNSGQMARVGQTRPTSGMLACTSPNRQHLDPWNMAEDGQNHVSQRNFNSPEKRSTYGPGRFCFQTWTLGSGPKKGSKKGHNTKLIPRLAPGYSLSTCWPFSDPR